MKYQKFIFFFFLICLSFFRFENDKERTPANLNQEFVLIDNADDAVNARLSMLHHEQEEIIASFHIWDGNKFGGLGFSKLMEKARQGVKVKLLLEAFGPIPWHDLYITPEIMKLLIDSGVELRLWNPANPKHLSTYIDYEKSKRNHDKLLICKGQKMVYEGDRNWQNINVRWQRTNGRNGHSYASLDAIIRGQEITDQATAYFHRSFAQGVLPDLSQIDPVKLEAMKRRFKTYENFTNERTFLYDNSWEDQFKPLTGSIEFFGYDPSKKGEDFEMDEKLIALIKSAKEGEEVVITTPFTRFPKMYMDAFYEARAKGIKIQLYTADIRKYGNEIIAQVYERHQRELESIGVEVHVSRGGDLLHAKSITVGGNRGYLGTHNFNMRSTFLDLDSGFFYYDNPDLAAGVLSFVEEQGKLSSSVRSSGRSCLSILSKILVNLPKLRRQF